MPVPPRGTRPRNRRALIIKAAAELFATRGYPHVGMTDLAAAVAIGPSALYRHFRGKQEVLFEALLSEFAAIDPSSIDSLAESVLAHRGLGVLWQRESRRLASAERAKVATELVAVQQKVAAMVDSESADLLAWATMATLMSVSWHRVELSPPELAAVATEVLATRLPRSTAPPPPLRPTGRSTRDKILVAAIQQFATRGYDSVSIEEIGAAAGIAGPSIYHHFASKVDILVAGMQRGAAELRTGLTAAADPDSRTALTGILRSYVDYALANSDILDLLIAEVDHLPDEHRRPLRTAQREYVGEWTRLMGEVHPKLTESRARLRIHAALTVANDLARTPHLSTRPGIATAITAIGQRILML